MKFSDLRGQNRATRQLVRSMQIGCTVHAHIIEGPYGSGKRTLASICARALVCEATAGEKPCGVCASCIRAENGDHPDIITVSPAVEKGRERLIGVETVRSVIDRIAVRPYEGGYMPVIFTKASMLTVQAQNALLKTLETPPANVVFFLLTESSSSLLPTVISRSRVTRMPVLSRGEVYAELLSRGVPKDKAARAADISGGTVGLGARAAEDAAFMALDTKLTGAFLKLKSAADVPLIMNELSADKDRADDLLMLCEQFGRDLMLIQNGAVPFAEERKDIYERAGFKGQELIAAVMTARMRLRSNVSFQSAMEMLFTQLVY